MPLSSCTFPVLELKTDTGPDVSRDSPLIPNIPRLVESSAFGFELPVRGFLLEGGSGMCDGETGVTPRMVPGRAGVNTPPRGIWGIADASP